MLQDAHVPGCKHLGRGHVGNAATDAVGIHDVTDRDVKPEGADDPDELAHVHAARDTAVGKETLRRPLHRPIA